jgi:hypothetical protein
MTLPLDPHPMVLKSDGSRHGREYDCGTYCRFAPREGYSEDLAAYQIAFELLDTDSTSPS